MIVNKKSITNFRIFTDLLLLNISFMLSAIYAQSFETLMSRTYLFILLLSLNILWYTSSNLIKLYDDYRSRVFSYQVIGIIKNVLWQVVFTILFIFFAKEDLFTRNFIVYYTFSLAVLINLKQYLFRILLKKFRDKEGSKRNLAIIGINEIGVKFKNLLELNPDFGYKFSGYIDEQNSAGSNDKFIGMLSELEQIIYKEKLTDVVIALSLDKLDMLNSIIRICDRNAVKSFIIPDYFRFATNKFSIDLFGDFPIIYVRSNPLEEAQARAGKRIFDFVFTSVVFVLLLWWLIPLIGILIKLDSKGPVFFIQNRIGRNNKLFRCYKFRTMTNEPPQNIVSHKVLINNENRITKLGAFLRKTNLDEIPQFINVLIGNMSVVGPRPHAISFDKMYSSMVEEIKLRHRIKPGITGWAQIHGLRGDVQDEEENQQRTKLRIEYDIWYIENWSFWIDIEIIFLTIWQMIRRKNLGN